ncbi:hypothetical protein GUITHDRAFT_108520 [Guillardia theta CCMP2712]|uniref:PTM/DIR17-like Tudor domain-containing protein n=1 Tax=Guillardia theta (strain CCMP2712) TaxID=905079 RepID=L1JBE6_GUITC|nr:hypothetical protein GUITHDRAFT_108520 [Guillardia theta CCMP2712]EKX45642.1 hypothetical protein GUITHDRAFT_108520 [Guillardia theta CCMP2712]|eukprot:XP_005832622.1 hypothetical protein GUITHDRAFT_108520 [Guillardia theta CCMP2712]
MAAAAALFEAAERFSKDARGGDEGRTARIPIAGGSEGLAGGEPGWLPQEHCVVGKEIEAQDFEKNWYRACIKAVNLTTREVKVRFAGWSSRWDEWISISSGRVRMIKHPDAETICRDGSPLFTQWLERKARAAKLSKTNSKPRKAEGGRRRAVKSIHKANVALLVNLMDPSFGSDGRQHTRMATVHATLLESQSPSLSPSSPGDRTLLAENQDSQIPSSEGPTRVRRKASDEELMTPAKRSPALVDTREDAERKGSEPEDRPAVMRQLVASSPATTTRPTEVGSGEVVDRAMARLLDLKQSSHAVSMEEGRPSRRRRTAAPDRPSAVKEEGGRKGSLSHLPSSSRQTSDLRGRDLIGARVRKHFRRYGVYGGRVVKLDRWYTILYEDGDVEDFTLNEVLVHLVDASCSLGMNLLEQGQGEVKAELPADLRPEGVLAEEGIVPFLWSAVKSGVSCKQSVMERRGEQDMLDVIERRLFSLVPCLDKSQLLMSTWALAAMNFEGKEPLLTLIEDRVRILLEGSTEEERNMLLWSFRQLAKGDKARRGEEEEREEDKRRQNPNWRRYR